MSAEALPDRCVLVRVAPELLAHMKAGDVEPVVILGVQDNGDGTHDMTLMRPDIVVERDRLAGEVERLRETLKAERQAVLDVVNIYGDETLHKALDNIGWPDRWPDSDERRHDG